MATLSFDGQTPNPKVVIGRTYRVKLHVPRTYHVQAVCYYGFGILPTKDMGVAFMSPEFLRHYKHAIETASRLDLKMCLYDEFWFPSSTA